MEVSNIIVTMAAKLWPFLLIAAALSVMRSAWFKGIAGEFFVNTLARLFLPKGAYHLVKNVTLPTEDGSTQIDHVIVSRYGVFVVETKNLKGWIFGSPTQKTWTQRIFKVTHKFQNPLHQNYKHIKVLEDCLQIEPEKLFSLVVFVGGSKFKTEMPDNVVHGLGYIRFIKSKRELVLSDVEVDRILKTIESGRLTPSFVTNHKHVKHVQTIVSQKKVSPPAKNACPKCGGEMVRRQAQKGANAGKAFWGCSTFPKCRGVRAL
ncbi:nuclease [Oleiphilus sp. HI0079]|uniref:nuclease-related domain-containing protein n=1 Tax=Oleiphilus sp. HI0079 TaxID=1822254 RepID=UPI0007C3FAD4|nr:NERD domain-containing protein [Oleiphilus sp. HI0079]KZZ14740.1 nuclease [Oleiphilus sp. HI0079]